MRRIGVLISTTEDDPQLRRQVAALQEGLRELGWIEGRNVRIDTRVTAADPDRLKAYAAELVALQPDALVASGPTPVLALQRETHTVPIVFAQVNDPVGSGLVATLARPGGNVTGFTPAEFSIGGKMLEVLKDLTPDLARFGHRRNTHRHSAIGNRRGEHRPARQLLLARRCRPRRRRESAPG